MAILFNVSDRVNIGIAGTVRLATVRRIETETVEEEEFISKICVQYDNGIYEEFADVTHEFNFVTEVV